MMQKMDALSPRGCGAGLGRSARATARLEASLALFRAVQEPVGVAEALRSLGFVVCSRVRMERRQRCLKRAWRYAANSGIDAAFPGRS
jgi:hypothetical protein